MGKYLRFGEIPKNEKSINFLKLTLQERKDFSWMLENCGIERTLKEIPQSAFEEGVSVFEKGKDGLPVIHNMKVACSLAGRIGYKIYEVSGDEVGRGNDGEPLIRNVIVEKKRKIRNEELAEHVFKFLATNFMIAIPPSSEIDISDYDISYFGYEKQVNFKTGEIKDTGGFEPDPGFIKAPYHSYVKFRGWEFHIPANGMEIE